MSKRGRMREGVGTLDGIEKGEPIGEHNRRILVIDDNPAIHEDFRKILCDPLADAMTEKWRTTQQAALKMNALEEAVEKRTREIREANHALQAEISERKLLENQLVQAQKLESIGQLAAGIAHEINPPIQYVGDNTRFASDAFKDINLVLDAYSRLLESADAGEVTSELVGEVKKEIDAADLEYLLEEVP